LISLDITKKGEGGNDYPVKATGVETVQVFGPEDTKVFIKTLLQM